MWERKRENFGKASFNRRATNLGGSVELGWIKRTKAKVRSNARDHGRGEDAKIGEKRSDTGTRESLRSVDRVRVPASMKLNLIPASSRARSSEAEVGGGGRSGGPSPPQKRGCSQGRATDPTSCRIQPLILPITNSTTLSLLARFGLAIIPATFSLLQLRRQPNLSLPRASSNRSPPPAYARHSYAFVIANRIFQLGHFAICLSFYTRVEGEGVLRT